MKRFLFIALALIAPLVLAGDGGGPVQYHFTHNGTVDVNAPGVPTACWNFEAAVAGTYTDDCDGSIVMTVNGSPTKVDNGTWPAGLSGSQGEAWTFDGATDYLSRADDGTFDPAGDFSIQFVFTPNFAVAGNVVAKWNAAAQRSWSIYDNAVGTLGFYISDDGNTGAGHQSGVAKNGLSAHRPAFVTVTYEYTTDGNSNMYMYIDNLSTASNTSADGPVFDSTADLTIGAINNGGEKYNGTISQCNYLDGIIITKAQHDHARNQWLGLQSIAGTPVTITSASPPAVIVAPPDSGLQPFIIDQPANLTTIGSPASGSGGLYGAGAISNLAQRRSFESWDDANTPTGWVDAETAGDGSAAISEETTEVAHGGSSVKMVLTGTTSTAYVRSACITCTADTCDYDMYLSAWAKKAGGTANVGIQVVEFDTNACGGDLQNQPVKSGDITTGWVKYHGLVAAASFHANTSSVYIKLQESGNGGVTTYFDAAQLRNASTPTDAFCGGDTDATSVCNLVDATATPPEFMTGTWEFTATVRSPIDGAVGAPSRRIMFVAGTAGDNNSIKFSWQSDTLYCQVYDSAGVVKTSTVAAAGNADTDYAVKISKDASTGTVQCCWDGTCDATPATGALTDGIGSEIVFGTGAGTRAYVWVNDISIKNRITE